MKTSSSKCAIIDHHYRLLGPVLEFNKDRVLRLCEAAQIKPRELAHLMRVPEKQFLGYIKKGMVTHDQTSLLLAMMEQAALGDIAPAAKVKLFPKL